MFAGHFGVAAAVKAKTPEIPLWALMISTQLYDIVFVPLQALGIESIVGIGYGNAWIEAFYSHSLVSALILAIAAGFIASRRWGRQSGVVLALVTFSHWILDFLVHRPDIPILPGNAGSFPLIGLGLWTNTTASIIVEASILAVGAILYSRYAWKKAGPGHRIRGSIAGAAMTLFLAGMFVISFL